MNKAMLIVALLAVLLGGLFWRIHQICYEGYTDVVDANLSEYRDKIQHGPHDTSTQTCKATYRFALSPNASNLLIVLTSLYCPHPPVRGVVTVENVCENEIPAIRESVSHYSKETNLLKLRETLQAKLGPKYLVDVYTVQEYLALKNQNKQLPASKP